MAEKYQTIGAVSALLLGLFLIYSFVSQEDGISLFRLPYNLGCYNAEDQHTHSKSMEYELNKAKK